MLVMAGVCVYRDLPSEAVWGVKRMLTFCFFAPPRREEAPAKEAREQDSQARAFSDRL